MTAGRVLVSSLSGTMHRVWTSESTPPLYYLFAWLWSHLFGVREVGLRSLSALFGTATVPVAYLAGRELLGRRTGLAVAAIVAVSPILVWYSQDARAYALLVLLSTAALVFFLRARRSGSARDLGWWAAFSALALATHYFAVFPLAVEAVWLLAAARPLRRVVAALAGIPLAGLALAPIALHQAGGKNNDWIASFHLLTRLHETGIAYFAGETGLLKHAAGADRARACRRRPAALARRAAGEGGRARRGRRSAPAASSSPSCSPPPGRTTCSPATCCRR